MSRRAQDNLFCLVLLFVFLGFEYLSLQLGSFRARLVPMPIAAISILLLLLQLYFQNFRPDIKLNVDSVDLFKISDDTVDAEEEVEDFTRKARKNARSEFNAFAVVLVLFVMVILLGILEGAFLFILGYFLLYGRERIYVALAWSAGSTVVFYLLFFRIIGLQPWEGLIRLTFFS